MGAIVMLCAFWLPFLIPAAPAAIACWIGGRNRVDRFRWEWLILVLPYILWMGLAQFGPVQKSMSNAVIEPFLIGCGVAGTFGIRFLLARRVRQKPLTFTLLVSACLLAWVLAASVPTMAE